MRRVCMLAVTLSLAVTLGAAVPLPASAQEAQDYTVREGDTCGRIARRVYGNSRRYDLIHEANPELGAMPHRLRPGTVLRLPAASGLGDADATVTAARRQVRSQRPRRSDWNPARVGQELNRGWRVSTGERSSAELTFQSGSVAALRAETLVIVYGSGARQVREEGAHAVIRGGSMLSRLSALSGGSTPLEVETPTAVATLDEGESSVDVDEDGTTRVATHRGRAARVRNREAGSAEVSVPEGQGTSVRQGRPPTPPRPLPPTPAWAPDQPSRFLGLSDHGGTLRGSWLPVSDARSYRVEVARREDGREMLISTEVPASVTSLEFHRLPADRYYVRINTIDAEHFEGRPGAPVALDVVGATIVPPGADAPPPLDAQSAMLADLDGFGDVDFERPAPARVPVLQGSRLISPEGVTCAAGASTPSTELVFETVGEQHLTCVDAGGQNIVGVDVAVITMGATLLEEDGTPLASLVRGETRTVRVMWEPASTPAHGMGLASGGLTLSAVEPHPDGGLRAQASVPIDAPAEVGVTLARGNATLAEARAAVTDAAVAPLPAPAEEPGITRVPEALGLAGTPSAVGLQDERRRGSGIWLSLGLASARLGEDEVRLRTAAGVRASFFEERLRVDAMIPLDIIGVSARRADLGSRDVFASVSSLILDGEEGFGLAASAGIWVPTASEQGLNAGRLQVAADLSWRTDDGLITIRTRQAGIFDLVADESVLWASAYGVDIAVYGPLVVGVEGDMTIGQEDLRDWYAGSAALNVGLDVDPVFVSLGFRYGFGDDLFPTAMLVGNVRGSFDP
ncbi:MAG: FecR domain-containing protein [Sandaracinaceae bacterium]